MALLRVCYFLDRDFLSVLSSFFASMAAFLAIFTATLAFLNLALAALTRARGSSIVVSTWTSGAGDGFSGWSFIKMRCCQLRAQDDVGNTGFFGDEMVTLGLRSKQRLNCYNLQTRP